MIAGLLAGLLCAKAEKRLLGCGCWLAMAPGRCAWLCPAYPAPAAGDGCLRALHHGYAHQL